MFMLCLGCGAPDISGSITEYIAAVDGSRTRSCFCPELQGYSSATECADGVGQVGSEGEACIADALEGKEEEGREFLDCAAEALWTYTDCLATNDSCEESVLMSCQSDRDASLDTCPGSELRLAVSACAS